VFHNNKKSPSLPEELCITASPKGSSNCAPQNKEQQAMALKPWVCGIIINKVPYKCKEIFISLLKW
jgi:hypothetical protein